jgi:hypothetical protein
LRRVGGSDGKNQVIRNIECLCRIRYTAPGLMSRDKMHFFSLFELFFGETGVWTEGFMLAKQELHCLIPNFSPFCSGYLFYKFILGNIHYTGESVVKIPIRLILYTIYIAPIVSPLQLTPFKAIASSYLFCFTYGVFEVHQPYTITLISFLHSPPSH